MATAFLVCLLVALLAVYAAIRLAPYARIARGHGWWFLAAAAVATVFAQKPQVRYVYGVHDAGSWFDTTNFVYHASWTADAYLADNTNAVVRCEWRLNDGEFVRFPDVPVRDGAHDYVFAPYGTNDTLTVNIYATTLQPQHVVTNGVHHTPMMPSMTVTNAVIPMSVKVKVGSTTLFPTNRPPMLMLNQGNPQ